MATIYIVCLHDALISQTHTEHISATLKAHNHNSIALIYLHCIQWRSRSQVSLLSLMVWIYTVCLHGALISQTRTEHISATLKAHTGKHNSIALIHLHCIKCRSRSQGSLLILMVWIYTVCLHDALISQTHTEHISATLKAHKHKLHNSISLIVLNCIQCRSRPQGSLLSIMVWIYTVCLPDALISLTYTEHISTTLKYWHILSTV